MSYLAIQLIQIQYTDDQRGRADAERRKGIRSLPLEVLPGEGVLHDCRINAWDDYKPTTSTSGVPFHEGEAHIAGLRLRVEDDQLVWRQEAGPEALGPKHLFTTREGTWARVILNDKRANFDVKWLAELVVNAGLFAGPPASQVFRGTPAFERDLRRDFLRAGYR